MRCVWRIVVSLAATACAAIAIGWDGWSPLRVATVVVVAALLVGNATLRFRRERAALEDY
jgi:Flp pilus assembly protein TadB